MLSKSIIQFRKQMATYIHTYIHAHKVQEDLILKYEFKKDNNGEV